MSQTENINQLIERYLNAQTTPDEERQLRALYASGKPLPPRAETLRPLVMATAADLPASLQPDAILATADESDAFDAIVRQRSGGTQRSRQLWFFSAVAAAAAAVVVAFIAIDNQSAETNVEQEVAQNTGNPVKTDRRKTAAQSFASSPTPVAVETPKPSAAVTTAEPVAAEKSEKSAPAEAKAPKTLAAKSDPKPTAEPAALPAAADEHGNVQTAETPAESTTIDQRINCHRHIASISTEGMVAM